MTLALPSPPGSNGSIPSFLGHPPSLAPCVTSQPAHAIHSVPRNANPFKLLANLIAESLTDKLGEKASTLLAGLFGTAAQPKKGLTVCRLIKLYLRHCRTYYVYADGSPTPEVVSMERAASVLKRHFDRLQAADFGPLKLKKLREEMIAMGWCRRNVNQNVGRVRRIFRWGVENELVPPERYHALQSMPGLKMGRTVARESEPVHPVTDDLIEAVMPHVSAQVAAMIRLQLLTGMRPGEVIILRTCDVDRSAAVWVYTPKRHKTLHHGLTRQVFIGPKAQSVLLPFLRPEEPETPVFSAAEAEEAWRRKKHEARVTPMNEGNKPGSNVKRRPKKKPGETYCRSSYTRAISRACDLAFPVPDGVSPEDAKKWRKQHHWHPHQLRHSAATKLRKLYGIDAAQIILGHKTLAVTAIYAERDMESAVKIMEEIG